MRDALQDEISSLYQTAFETPRIGPVHSNMVDHKTLLIPQGECLGYHSRLTYIQKGEHFGSIRHGLEILNKLTRHYQFINRLKFIHVPN